MDEGSLSGRTPGRLGIRGCVEIVASGLRLGNSEIEALKVARSVGRSIYLSVSLPPSPIGAKGAGECSCRASKERGERSLDRGLESVALLRK